MNRRSYGDCSYCDGTVSEQRISLVRQWKGHFLLIEHVPAGVCNQCGERYFWGDVAEAMQRLMERQEGGLPIVRTIELPVVKFEMA